MSLLAQLEEVQGSSTVQIVGATRPRLREVSTLPSWCYCFLGYVATMTSDSRTRDQLAYARLIIRQAQSQGGLSWLDYDHSFRQQMATDPTMQWNILNPSLLASTTLGHRSSSSPTFCTLCRAVDHTRPQCALVFLEPPTLPAVNPQTTQQGPAMPSARRPCNMPGPVCYAWNRGSCQYAGRCTYRHICSICSVPAHKARDCPRSAPSSRPADQPTSRHP